MASPQLLVARVTGPIPADALPVKTGTHAQGISVQVTCGVFMALAWITVLLRFYTRGVLVRNIGADDTWILLAVIFFSVYNIACIVCAGATMGDVWLRVGKVDTAYDFLMVAESFYVVSMTALKISVSIFFLRVMVKPWQRWFIYISLALATAVNVAYFFVLVFQCGVPKGGMSFLMMQLARKCLSKGEMLAASYSHGVITTLTDVGFAILPLTVVKEMKLRLKERITVVAILTMAAVGGIASMVRLAYIPRLATATETWFMDANLIAIWSAVEPGLGIIASSLATLRPLFRGLLRTGNTTNSSMSLNNAPGFGYPKFFPSKPGATIEELPARKDEEGTPYDSFEFIQGGMPSIKGAPVGPHRHIEKEPWRPAPRPSTERRAPSRMGKAEELLGEDLSAYSGSPPPLLPQFNSPPVPVISRKEVPNILGNAVSCEGPPAHELYRNRSLSMPRCNSRDRTGHRRKMSEDYFPQ